MKRKDNPKHSMNHYLRPHKNKVLIICKEFTETGFYGENGECYGSLDTEPRGVFFKALEDKLKDDIENIPASDEWALYGESIDSKEVGQKMSNRLKELFKEIDKAKNFDITEVYEYYDLDQYKI